MNAKTMKKAEAAQERVRRVRTLLRRASDQVERDILPTVSDIYSYPHAETSKQGTKQQPRRGR